MVIEEIFTEGLKAQIRNLPSSGKVCEENRYYALKFLLSESILFNSSIRKCASVVSFVW